MRPIRRRRLAGGGAAVAVALVLGAAGASRAPAATTWLCHPDLADDPCSVGLDTTRYTPRGESLGVRRFERLAPRPVDCFYVYPTVSEGPEPQASLSRTPVVRSAALWEAARFGQVCRVFAPVYRQLTFAFGALPGLAQLPAAELAYDDVLDAWEAYLRDADDGRGVVVIGHSQGGAFLLRLLRNHVDRRPAVRRRLVSAILLGANVTVRKGEDLGGDFHHILACRRPAQLRCVIAYSTFTRPPPGNSPFGRPQVNPLSRSPWGDGYEVLCTNPAALRGGSGRLDPVVPAAAFAPGTVHDGMERLGIRLPHPDTPWADAPGSFSGRCSDGAGAHVLRIRPRGGAQAPQPVPDERAGLHLADVNIALGNLVDVVGRQAAAYRRVAGPGG